MTKEIIDSINPLGYTGTGEEYNEKDRPCWDLEETFAWIFWIGSVVIDEGGDFDLMKTVRGLLLRGLFKRDLKENNLYIKSNAVIAVEVKEQKNNDIELTVLCRYTTCKGTYFKHYVDSSSYNKRLIIKALCFNNGLKDSTKEDHSIRVGDIIYPPDVPLPQGIGQEYRPEHPHWSYKATTPILVTTRICPKMSHNYQTALQILSKCTSIYLVQLVLERITSLGLTDSEFLLFMEKVLIVSQKLKSKEFLEGKENEKKSITYKP